MPNDDSKSKDAPKEAADESPIKSESLEGPDIVEGTPADNQPTVTPTVKSEAEVTASSKGILHALNIYFVIFVILILLAVGAVLFAAKSAKKPPPKKTTTHSLTDQQIANLKGSTTLVGDAKQTLDVQSNSIFEGQVLLRNSLNVAGAIQAGGNVSVPSIKVGGVANLGQAQIDSSFNVAGDSVLQGQLTVQKSLSVAGAVSVGSLSASQLTVTSLQLKGDLNISKHVITSGSPVGRTSGTGLGAGGTVSVNGNDVAGTITVNTGSSPAAGLFATVSFTQKFTSTPHVIITPVGSAAGSVNYYVNRDTGGFSIGASTPAPAGSSFSFDYFVVQ
jgi:cytoskeletal protein CcmA (bactofilin family)